jgi:AbrB family transcriptional regulator, transcriptional pleiotropic regulator of transition state genes
MKSTGIVRRVDELGRIVIPMELRRTFGIEIKDPLEIFVDGDTIVLSKYQSVCVFCGSGTQIVTFKGKNVCQTCMKDLMLDKKV